MFITKELIRTVLVALTFTAFTFAHAAESSPLAPFKGESGVIRMSGGTAHIPILKTVAKRIMTTNSKIQISIAGGGSGVGIKQLGEGLVDVGNAGRNATKEEIKTYNLVQTKWAIDGVGVAVHPGNSVKALSTQQLMDIFSGKIMNWKEVGGGDTPIAVYTRDEASGTRGVFWKKALKKGSITKRANVMPSNGAMKTAISKNPNAIGYVSVGHIDSSIAPISLDGVPPTLANIKNGTYKVARSLFSNTKGKPKGLVAKLFAYLLSAEGQKLVAEGGFIPVK